MKIVIIICRQTQMASYHLPTGIGLVSACLKQAGHDVVMINPNHSLEDYQLLLEKTFKYHKPDVVATGGLGFQLNQIRFITDIARRI
ncbi:MAG: cobalamin B12-binding domain-containing protein, partial [Planctomycetes bacterium]|nr:cobalamin B12-binding domain-containing protein [Planctomycetota bacterium]